MIETLKKGLSMCQEEYADIRHETDEIILINLKGKKLNTISDSTTSGFHLRILSGGGEGSNSFSDIKDMPQAIKESVAAAKIGGKYTTKPIAFKQAPPVKDKVTISPEEDPRKVPLEEKLSLLKHYNDLILKYNKIQSTDLYYKEWVKHKYFVNSFGTELDQEQLICYISGEIIAGDGTHTENVRVEAGGYDSFSKIRNREDVFERKAKLAIDLLKAPKVTPGTYRVLLNQSMVGVFIHEAFGHFSEADIIKDNPGILEKLKLDTKIGGSLLTVIDDATLYGHPGFWVYDDEGVKGRETILIKDGWLRGRMHSMETAQAMEGELTGNNIAVGWKYTPIVRMSNIYIKPGEKSFDELLSSIDKGLYICDAKGGQTMGDQFSFGAQYGYEIKDGKLGKLLRGINMSGNLFTTLKNIIAIGNDLKFSESGGCGKGGQTNLQSGLGGPHTIIDDIVIG
ncbi:TldD/PmbA family protein [candidate division WOR-3 bacterium]|nr:TldD/PmbA family protein [candidate division WOR-3 bacterium]